MKIAQKSAVVTGATGGIGKAIAKALIEKQAGCVGIVDLSDKCQEVAEELNTLAGNEVAIPFSGDVTDPEFRSSVFASIKQRHDLVRICVPAAGILRDALATKLNRETDEVELYSEDTFRQVLDVNLMHPVYWSMMTLAGIIENRNSIGLKGWQPDEEIQGSIVLIGSVSNRGNRGQISYASAKSGLNGACNTLNTEGMFHGVQTRIVHPGMVNTPMIQQLPEGFFEEKVKPQIPLARVIEPSEIASVVIALIENPIISGQIWADGAMLPMT